MFVPPGRRPRKIVGGIFKGLRLDLDLTNGTQIYLGLFEREVYKWVKKLSVGIKTAIDIGACDGEYTLYFLARTSAEKILAFEPELHRGARLIVNLDLNGFAEDPRLELHTKFAGSQEGINNCTLDSLLPTILPPCLIKMDVDGGEVDILKGAKRLLELPGTRWIIETHTLQLEEECIRLLRQAGFVTTVIRNAWWRFFIPDMVVSHRGTHNRWLAARRASGNV